MRVEFVLCGRSFSHCMFYAPAPLLLPLLACMSTRALFHSLPHTTYPLDPPHKLTYSRCTANGAQQKYAYGPPHTRLRRQGQPRGYAVRGRRGILEMGEHATPPELGRVFICHVLVYAYVYSTCLPPPPHHHHHRLRPSRIAEAHTMAPWMAFEEQQQATPADTRM